MGVLNVAHEFELDMNLSNFDKEFNRGGILLGHFVCFLIEKVDEEKEEEKKEESSEKLNFQIPTRNSMLKGK